MLPLTLFPWSILLAGPKHSTNIPFSVGVAVLFNGFSSSNVGGRVIIVIITKRELHLKCFYIYRCQIGGTPSVVCTSLAVRDYVGLPIPTAFTSIFSPLWQLHEATVLTPNMDSNSFARHHT